MEQSLQKLIELLDLEEIEKNIYRGVGPDEGWQRVYGGQVIGQALVAASRTVEPDRHAHSLHGYFLRPGDPSVPILYTVDRIRDGRSFTTRRVVAIQHGRPIFNMSISFQVLEDGLSHQITMPEVPRPESLRTELELRAEWAIESGANDNGSPDRKMPIEIRPLDKWNPYKPERINAHNMCWMKARDTLPEGLSLHQCVLAYLSDWTLLDSCIRPHGVSFLDEKLQVASLDHAMWFHRPFKADEWLLYVQDSPSSSGGRGLNCGTIYNRAGELVASVVQEGLIRLHD